MKTITKFDKGIWYVMHELFLTLEEEVDMGTIETLKEMLQELKYTEEFCIKLEKNLTGECDEAMEKYIKMFF